ncbi:MAG: TlpA family protein disulfide reductase [Desulfohalobiaceae bacterium]|nr:TlpA family protein disulfide reductase [Desulfohalobiaceae bacterium]
MAKIAHARGKLVLINFWATWCSSCRKEIEVLSRLCGEYPEKSVILLGVSMDDSAGSLSRFLSKQEINYPVYMAGRGVASSFSVSGVPKTVIYNREGRKVYSKHGFLPARELRRILDRILQMESSSGE